MRLYWNHAVFYRTYDITCKSRINAHGCLPISVHIFILQQSSNYETGIAYSAWIWTLIECLLGLICACLPPLRPLFKRFLRSTVTGNSYPVNSYGWSKNITASSGMPDNSYHLQSNIRRGTSVEWDKNSNSSSAPLDQSNKDDGIIVRTDNIEVTYNQKSGQV